MGGGQKKKNDYRLDMERQNFSHVALVGAFGLVDFAKVTEVVLALQVFARLVVHKKKKVK